MRLQDLISGTSAALSHGAAETDITGLTADSRAVKPGMLFTALPGSATDGATFVPAAVAAGAAAVLVATTAKITVPAHVTVVRADEPRLALAKIAANFYPRQPKTIVAITGTNGKTSIAEFTRQIFAHLGHKAASLGTIGVVKPGGAVYGSLTTPDPITLHQTLDALAREGITHLALEASSHGLDQFRLDGVRLSAGAFNNLGRDHLDYHPSVEAYLDAKLQLFKRLLQPGQPAVVNVDGPRKEAAIAASKSRGLSTLEVGGGGDFINIEGIQRKGFEQRLLLRHATKSYTVDLNLIGAYQSSNAVVAAALAIACGDAPDAAIQAIEKLEGVKGRLEVVGRQKDGIAVIDYAHKPEALVAALDALRPFATGKLICVFGCGGNRDKGKRPVMGDIAVRKADVVIVTDDNPRNEDPAMVRAEILAAAKGAIEISDRGDAIRAAVAMLGPGDVLLVAGKGHETGQIIAGVTHPFSDHDVIAAVIAGTPELSKTMP
jgi:UDP-N-acetylmuramoyl-L-alanyl-D-glutamate--2,6-diaminopimelate ligase